MAKGVAGWRRRRRLSEKMRRRREEARGRKEALEQELMEGGVLLTEARKAILSLEVTAPPPCLSPHPRSGTCWKT